MFSEKDFKQIKSKGIDIEKIHSQIENFKKGFPPSKLVSAATIDHGIIRFSEDQVKQLADNYEHIKAAKSVLKFVPASGVASRMFKHLFEFREEYSPEKEAELIDNKELNPIHYFFKHIKNFAFYKDLKDKLEVSDQGFNELLENKEYIKIINALLDEDGLNYAALPKALLKFHEYPEGSRMSAEEHLVEGAVYGKGKTASVKIHFTVSPEHLEAFKSKLSEVESYYNHRFDIRLNPSYSIQKPSTDVLAVDMENQPLRDEEENLVFRPGGHGALIENLNELNADLIFVKNIDNIVPDRLRKTTYLYKKVLASYLLKLQKQCFDYLRILEKKVDARKLDMIANYAKKKLMIALPESFESEEAKKAYLIKKLNRPIRCCGMVKNEGEPGGGPFWVKNTAGEISLQIVESSQMDLSIDDQKKIAQEATHFNPVDLVCGVKDYKGQKFDLTQFVDPDTGFISQKSQNGKDLKAQELPGLWNGAMADWITIFVECPIITFNPVKIVNDLLREQHQ